MGAAWLGLSVLVTRSAPVAAEGAARAGARSKSQALAVDEPSIRPRLPFAKAYGVTPRGLVKKLGPAKLRREVVADVVAQARAAGITDIEENPRLDAAMTMLAESLRPDELPALEVLDFLLESYGVVGPSPQLVISRASGTPPPTPDSASAELRGSLAQQLGSVLKEGAALDLGVGLAASKTGVVLIVAVQHRLLRLSPLPRAFVSKKGSSKKGSIKLDLTLLGAERKPEALVTTPAGSTHPLELTPADKSAVTFRTSVGCDDGRGRYQLEVVGQNPKAGNVVLANLPFFCDVPPPTSVPRPTAGTKAAGPIDARTAEERLAALVNEDRKRAGLPALILDPAWSAVARAHSREMAERNVVAHTSPGSGTAMDRTRKAGLSSQALLENLGAANSPEEVERGLMASPGHRQNILDPGVKRMGIGVAVRPPGAGGASLFVTQLFAAP